MHESEKWKWSCSVVSDSSRPHGLQPTSLLRPWDFLGKSTGVGCHCLLRHLVNVNLCKCKPLWYKTLTQEKQLESIPHEKAQKGTRISFCHFSSFRSFAKQSCCLKTYSFKPPWFAWWSITSVAPIFWKLLESSKEKKNRKTQCKNKIPRYITRPLNTTEKYM